MSDPTAMYKIKHFHFVCLQRNSNTDMAKRPMHYHRIDLYRMLVGTRIRNIDGRLGID